MANLGLGRVVGAFTNTTANIVVEGGGAITDVFKESRPGIGDGAKTLSVIAGMALKKVINTDQIEDLTNEQALKNAKREYSLLAAAQESADKNPEHQKALAEAYMKLELKRQLENAEY